MSLIHSWSPASKSILFVCTNSNMELYSIELSTTQCDAILKCLQQIVKQVLTSRKERALSETEVIDLLSAMRAAKTGSKSQLDVLKTRVSGRYLTSDKAFLVTSSFSDTFDKMEATLFLQSHLVDQNKFSRILEAFESDEEVRNIWHRIYTKLY